MNQKDLKKALTAYKGVFETEGAEAVKEQMIEGEFSEADIEQVLAALQPEPKKLDKAKTGFEEWVCDGGTGEKLKLKRAGVQISDEEAETLNAGRTTGGNVNNVLMYFKPE